MRRCEKGQSRLSVVKKNVHSEDSQFTLPRCEIFNLTHISKARRKGNCLEAEEFKTTKYTFTGRLWVNRDFICLPRINPQKSNLFARCLARMKF